jgi:uncharacterized membrane protein
MQLFFYPIGDSYWVVAIVTAVLAALLPFAWGRGKASAGRRAVLVAIRVLAIVLVVLAMLRPTLVYTRVKKEAATLIVAADQSRSMSVRDDPSGKTRWQAMRRTLDGTAKELDKLSRDMEIKAYTFDAELHPAAIAGGKIALPEVPAGRETAYGAALDEILRQQSGKRVLGIILLGDGRQQAVAPHDVSPQTVAAKLRHQGDPVFPVVFGQSRGPGAAQDVAVRELLVNERVFVKNELSINGQVRVDGYVNRDVPVRVLFETSPGKMEVVAQQNVKATADGQLMPVHFTYIPTTPGEYKLVLEAVPQAGELVTTNNQLTTFVQVLKGGLNVLYVEGALRVEQKFIRRALDAARDIKVDSLRLDPRQPASLPSNMDELLRPGKYEVYILGDVDSSAFRESDLKQLAEAVNRGAGLIMLGGFHSFGPGGYWNTPLAEVLPVVMDRLERQRPDDPVRADLHLAGPLRMRPTPVGLRHFALLLAADPRESEAIWDRLPPLEGANRFLKLSPGAVSLADADGDEKKPLMVTQNYGAGRVLAFAGDSTWHWWMQGHDAADKRFWRQIVLWLARKDQVAEGNVWVRLEGRRFAPGDKVEFTAGAQSPGGEPIKDAELTAEVLLPPGSARTPCLLQSKEDFKVGTFRDTQAAGDFVIEVTAKQKGQLVGTARARFSVTPQDLELDNASADRDTMASVAKATGGRLIEPEQLAKEIDKIAQQAQRLEVEEQTKKTLWDKWPFFLSLVGLLCVEWYLRKRWGMV